MKTLQFMFIVAYCFIGHFGFSQSPETRELAPFSKIKIKDNATVELRLGSPQEVRVESKAPLGEVKTTSEDGTLTIQGPPSTVYVTVPEISSISILGVGKVHADSLIKAATLRIAISGNGKVAMPIEAGKLEAGISGIGKLELKGSAETVEANISGSGKIEGEELQVKNCVTNISGVGKCFMDVTESLELNISGSGSFYYKSKPASLSVRTSGIGKYGLFSDANSSGSETGSSGGKRVTVIGHDDDDDRDDNFSFHWENDSVYHRPEKARSHWGGLDIGFNQLMVQDKFNTNLPEGFDYLELNSGKSININLNLFKHDFQLYKRYVLFTTGIGLTLNNYRFSSDKTLIADSRLVTAGFDSSNSGKRINYDKNKLAVNYITVPLLLQFNTREHFRKSFHVAAGMLLSYKYNSHLKLVYTEDGDREKSKRHDEFNIQPFRYDATLRIGYENYTLYASYALNSLFKEDRGPSLHPFQVGINLFGW
ncbi:MAG: DUF2807 domain-containing protein [Bacteroidia bacterium]|nr:DUF2807 domain-containing protein [Bacteroidia bacterium]